MICGSRITMGGGTRRLCLISEVHGQRGIGIGVASAGRWPSVPFLAKHQSGVVIGDDINCGVRLLATDIDRDELEPHLKDLATVLYRTCPSGVGAKGSVHLSAAGLDEVLRDGARWALRNGMARAEDLELTEEN